MDNTIGTDRPLGPLITPAPFPETRKVGGEEKTSFADMLQSFVKDVNQLQNRGGEAVQKFIAGEIKDPHQVTLALGEARMALNLLIEIRNKTMEAYNEIIHLRI